MKKIYLFVLLLLFTSNLISQPWTKSLPQGKSKGQLTLSHYKDAFNQYWAPFNVSNGYYDLSGVKTKAVGWKQFKRWEYYMEREVNPGTGEFPRQTAREVQKAFIKAHPVIKAASIINPSNWTSLGPTTTTGGYAGVGRINCIAFHPIDNNTWWVGAAAGGLWVTTNNGTNWSCLTDDNGVLAVSDIIIPTDYATSNTLYIATGDRDHWDNNSIGVLKSTDGGSTWNTTGINYLISDGSMVSRLLADPGNNQTIIAATSNGVFKTTDGGTTWSTKLSAINFIDLEYKPGDFNTLYGSTSSGTIYVSVNGGSTWTQSFSNAGAYRISLAVSANQPAVVYAIAGNSSSGLYGIYRSTNSGTSFNQVFAGTTKNLLGWAAAGTDSGGQSWYDLSISASPSNANTLLVGGVNTWRSLDGGTTWTIVNHWSGSTVQAVHADKHMLLYRSDGSLFECNDGGVYISTDNGTSWTNKTNGIVISQMYKLGVSQATSNETVTGLQDNGTKLLSGGIWNDVKGGDGMECLIDYTNANIQYGTYVDGQIDRTTNHWSSATDISANIPGGLGATGSWVTPYLIDPVNPQILYIGYSDIWKTTDRGNTWTKISSMNSLNKIRSMAIAQANTQVVYVADPSVIWKTADGGISWANITGSLPVGSGSITSIAVKSDDEKTLWVTLGGYNTSKVFQSVNSGTTWTDLSAGLPAIPAYSIVQNTQINTEIQLYVGTEVGIYFKKGSDNWMAYNTGLPNVSIGEIEIYYAANPQDSRLRAATFGRGLWESPVYYSSAPMTYVSGTTTQNNISTIGQNTTDQEVIGIQLITDGYVSPLSATSFTFNTTGSTNPAIDISNAKLYYTGSTNSLGTTSQFGSTSLSPNGSFTISGTQVLNAGTNYFWLTYDVPVTAVLGDLLDAQCTSLTVGTVTTPVVIDPPGNRAIGVVNYCASGSPDISYEYISNVAIGSINQSSGRGTGGYQDYTSQITTIQIGTNYSATINVTNPYTSDQVLIWADWNRNGVFTDAGENIFVSSGTFATPLTTTNFTPPEGTTPGTTRMRIRLIDAGAAGSNSTPCGDSSYGETEDYTLNIIAGCIPPPAPTGTTPQIFCGGTTPTIASLTATGTAIKWYTSASGGTALSSTTTLVNSTHYYASQTVSSCESTTRFEVIAMVSAVPTTPAVGTITQPTCALATGSVILNSLPATGTWTLTRSPGAVTLTGTGTTKTISGLVSATYSYTVTNASGCISAASANIVINAQPAAPAVPTGTASQTFCTGSSATVASLTATGTAIKWYAAATGGTALSSTTALVNGSHYYASQTISSCESTLRFDVTVTLTAAPVAPTGSTAQTFCAGTSTVANLVATGAGIKWYSAATGGTALVSTTALVNGTHYYASQSTGTCESTTRLNVTVTLTAAPATPAAIGGTKTVCVGSTTALTDATTGGVWSSLTPATATVSTTGVVTGIAPGAVTIRYTVSNAGGCTNSATATVTVIALPTLFTVTGGGTFCSGGTGVTVGLSGSQTGVKYQLKSGTANSGSAVAGTGAALSFGLKTGAGTYTVVGTTTSGSCPKTMTGSVAVTVNALPTAPAAIGGTKTVCVGNTTTLTDATAGGVWSSLTPATASISTAGIVTGVAAGTVTIRYTVTNANGCSRFVSATVTVSAPPAQPGNFTASTAAVTLGQSNVVYTVPNVSGVTYKWSYTGTGATITGTTNSVLVSYSLTATSGTLGVTATTSCGTSIARTIAITGLKAAVIPAGTLQGAISIPPIKSDISVAKNELNVYPNPTLGQTTFEFVITQNAKVTLDIYSMNGQHIARIFDASLEAGIRQKVFFDQSLSTGTYPCIMRWNSQMITVKLIITQ